MNSNPSRGPTSYASSDYNEDDLKDLWCDPENPRVCRFEEISAAAYRIKDGIVKTSCDLSHMNNDLNMELYFKKDYMQFTGSFKERGARYTLIMLPQEQKQKGVIAASAGNHAQALAYHGTQLGIPVTVVMPIVAPIMKVENCKNYGAKVVVHGADIGESRLHALKLAHKKGLMYINGYDHPNIIAGQGTLGLEVLDQVPDLDAMVIPVGGGGLIAGIARALKTMKPDVMIIGVEPELCPSFSTAMKHGKAVHTPTSASLADGLTVPTVGVNALATGAPLIDKIVTVSEAWIAIAILRLVELEKAVVEGAGATPLAAILAGLLPELEGKKVVLPICGGNIDTTLLGRCLERGLAADGRLITFQVTVSDRPGGIAELARLISNVGVSIKDIVHERAWVRTNTFAVGVRILAETRNRKHSKELFKLLRENYEEVNIMGFYESPEDYVAGNLQSSKFESVEDETPFEGNMNIQYNQDLDNPYNEIVEEDELTSASPVPPHERDSSTIHFKEVHMNLSENEARSPPSLEEREPRSALVNGMREMTVNGPTGKLMPRTK